MHSIHLNDNVKSKEKVRMFQKEGTFTSQNQKHRIKNPKSK